MINKVFDEKIYKKTVVQNDKTLLIHDIFEKKRELSINIKDF